MDSKEFFKQIRQKSPKTWARIDKRWDIKMIGPVHEFVFGIMKHINPKAVRAIKKDDYLIAGPEIEQELWKLLAKVRRVTQREKIRHE